MAYPVENAKRLGVVIPSTNTTVERDFLGFHVPDVSHHVARIHVPDMPIGGDDDFGTLIELARSATIEAIVRVTTANPDHLVMGISSDSVWDGKAGCDRLRTDLQDRFERPVTLAADACIEALRLFPEVRTIAIFTPYTPAANARTKAFFEEMGFTVPRIEGFACKSPTDIAAVPVEAMMAAIERINGDDVDAILQFGTNLPFAVHAEAVEKRLGKPVIAVNAALYRHALRQNGIGTTVNGFGRVLTEA